MATATKTEKATKRRATKKFDRPILEDGLQKLSDIIKKKGVSQSDIAKKLKWPDQVVHRALKQDEKISLRALAAMATALGYKVELRLMKVTS